MTDPPRPRTTRQRPADLVRVVTESLAATGLHLHIEADDEDWDDALQEALDRVLGGERNVVVKREKRRGGKGC